jgi:hypothetical protein
MDSGDYIINSIEDLMILAKYGQISGMSYKLSSDLNFEGYTNYYIPIFSGIFKGNNHIISNVNINLPNDEIIGLFGLLNTTAEVKDIVLQNSNIYGYYSVGTIAGYNNGTISNCRNNGLIRNDGLGGGISGSNKGTIVNCINYATVETNDPTEGQSGGICGDNRGLISKCQNFGTITGTNSGGGIVAYSGYPGVLINCYNRGAITAISYGGGIAGGADGDITNCYNSGSVTATSNKGGICGMIQGDGTMSNTFWDNQTSLPATSSFGISSYTGTITNCVGKLTQEMKDINTFTSVGWDFGTVWNINGLINNGYPYLQVNYSSETLPVTLSSFTALETSSNLVTLNWVTQSESGLIGYYVYKNETNNLNSANRISTLINAENTGSENSYSFNDTDIIQESDYYYWLMSTEQNGLISYYGPIHVKTSFIGDQNPVIPLKNGIESIYPNPFNPNTNISYTVKEPGNVKIEIFNLKGQLIKQFSNYHNEPGKYSINWNGKNSNDINCGTGVYLCRMSFGNNIYTRKMNLLK